jgi:hypothetical protein
LNTGYLVAGLGVLGLILGIGMYAASWHRTIGLGGVGVGAVLLLAGIWLARSRPKATPQASQPQA